MTDMAPERKSDTFGLVELRRRFSTEDKCFAWLEKLRWNGTPACPRCESIDDIGTAPPTKPHNYWCKACRRYFTVTTGTVMHSHKTPLQHWMIALHTILSASKGVSAMQLSNELNVQYKTAWHMLHRFSEAFKLGSFTLSNVVDPNDTYIGAKGSSKHNLKRPQRRRNPEVSTPEIRPGQRDAKTAARAAKRLDNDTIAAFIPEQTNPVSTVQIDDTAAYGGLITVFNHLQHETVKHNFDEYVPGEAHTNRIESVWSVIKHSISVTLHHGSVKHLDRYINAAAFRHNERNVDSEAINQVTPSAAGMDNKPFRVEDQVA